MRWPCSHASSRTRVRGSGKGTRAFRFLTVKLLQDRGRRGGSRCIRQQELGFRLDIRECDERKQCVGTTTIETSRRKKRNACSGANHARMFRSTPDHFLCGSETNERFGRPRRRTGPLHSADSWEGHEPTEPIARAHTCSARARDARPRHLKRDGERREMKGLNRHCHYSSTVLAVPVRQLTWHGFLERGAAEPPELRRVIFDDGARPARRRSPLSFPSFDSPSSSSALTAWRSGRCLRA